MSDEARTPPRSAPRLTLCGSASLHPVGTGAAMHLAGYRALGLPFTYVPFGVTDLTGAITGMRALGIRGLGISMPFKQSVIPLLDELDPMAARIGAVNTVVQTDGQLVGHNTDWIGALCALEEQTLLAGARVLLLGAGGAARAIAHGLVDRGAVVTIANRDLDKAKRLAREAGARASGLAEARAAAAVAAHDVVVNATSLGMGEPTEPVLDPATLRPGLVVMDIVYKPLETELVRAARARGASAIHGGRMLLFQAARQFELYTGVPAPLEAMDAALSAELAATSA